MSPLEVQIIVSVATILCSGVVSAYVTHRLSVGQSEREFRRKKLEELYFAIHTYCIKLFSTNMFQLQAMRGEITINDANQHIIQYHQGKEDKSHDVAQMLVNIYFPKLKPQLAAIINRRDRINQVYSQFRRDGDGTRYAKRFADELKGIDLDESSMADALFRLGEKYR